ncbi:MAG: hypothetical protein A2745_01975 [Candidatus Harrisonbacteria bacterium RIFCSPHIGHO2_01_FULL_44_13]|uniref:Uncharacterized protein n=1 Tax=Candidatus Harrisonbacteria bacterium RIFCSPLOWO2_01_FULL_44_18 TaxID=1798407 RepID=A0A1G1ZPH6_9BACT|nr:MAG: hypothetical protein A2745_01975 [Candidatus Harrisonbacteria bacterium RIFCSPHIGHO2_01_FULL_44_13]OGY66329.1 MAG: hypothetical protein A3A16_00250 [Candidatus Harrisonbacteria bacterium RIFCSPLOWO2_01_FULL_44_18]
MTKKRIVSKNKEMSAAERYFGVVLEDVNSKFDQVLEGNAALSKEFGGFRDEFKEFRNETNFKFGVLTGELKETNSKISNLESKTSNLESKISNLESKYDKNFDQILAYLSKIDEEIQDLKTRLDGKADLERLERVEQEVAQIKLIVKKHFPWQE